MKLRRLHRALGLLHVPSIKLKSIRRRPAGAGARGNQMFQRAVAIVVQSVNDVNLGACDTNPIVVHGLSIEISHLSRAILRGAQLALMKVLRAMKQWSMPLNAQLALRGRFCGDNLMRRPIDAEDSFESIITKYQ